MKILYHHRIGSRDGQSVHVDSLIQAFTRLGHEVEVISPPQFRGIRFGTQTRSFASLKRLLPRVGYEFLEFCYNLAVAWRLELAVRRFRPDVIYERYNLFLMAGVVIARLHRVPIFLEVNAPLARERSAFGGLSLPRFAGWVEQQTWRAADFVLPVTGVLADVVRSAGVSQNRTIIIPNGIDEEFLTCLDTDDQKRAMGLLGKTVLGFVGFVREWHGIEWAIDLLAHEACPTELHLSVIGDGPALPSLKSRAERLGISHKVTFCGLVNRNDLAYHLTTFDIALQPRAVEYASPLKLFEYMAFGKAIVAPDQPNIREVLQHGIDALLFNPSDESSFRQAVFLLARQASLRERLGRRARQIIIDRRYTWIENARRITSLYEDGYAGRVSTAS